MLSVDTRGDDGDLGERKAQFINNHCLATHWNLFKI